MQKKKINPSAEISPKKELEVIEKEKYIEAHHQADKDIERDPDFNSKPRPENDLDEGELARLEGED